MNYSVVAIDVLKKMQESAEASLFARQGVIAVGVGFKYKNGQNTSGLAIQVFVEKKKEPRLLSPQEMISIQGIPTDVIEMALPRVSTSSHASPSGHFNPLVGGVEIGRINGNSVGTLGGVAFDVTTNAPVAITNWHVAAGAGNAPVGGRIAQPGISSSNDIGVVDRASLGQIAVGWVDAARVLLGGSRGFSQSMNGIGGNATQGAHAPRLGMIVVKSGRTTGVTHGRIDTVNATVRVNYGATGIVEFRNQLIILPQSTAGQVSDGGDSGSLWLEYTTNRAVALNFAGEAAGDPNDRAIANPIFAVLHALGAKFEPEPHTVFRWFHGGSSDHFYCSDPGGEYAPVVGYEYEGAPFCLFSANEPSAVPFFRWYNPSSNDHFYTTDPSGELAPQVGYIAEGVLGHIRTQPADGLVLLHRWFNGRDHFYTTHPTGEIAPQVGYRYEGAAGWVKPR